MSMSDYIPCVDITITCLSCGRVYYDQWLVTEPEPQREIEDCFCCNPRCSHCNQDGIDLYEHGTYEMLCFDCLRDIRGEGG